MVIGGYIVATKDGAPYGGVTGNVQVYVDRTAGRPDAQARAAAAAKALTAAGAAGRFGPLNARAVELNVRDGTHVQGPPRECGA